MGVEGAINLGFIIRLAHNFNVDELYLVEPKIDLYSDEVLKFAAKGREYIDRVKIVSDFIDSLNNIDLVACTSSIIPSRRDPLRQAIELKEFRDIASNYSSLALVFGRESTGLTRKELQYCNLYVHIRAGKKYPTLNLSHSVAIALYELYDLYGVESSLETRIIDRNIVNGVIDKVTKILEHLNVSDDRRIWILKSFERILYSTKTTNNDLLNLLYLLNKILNICKDKD